MTEWLYDYLPQYILLGVRLGDLLHKIKAMKDPLIAQVLYELHSVISNIWIATIPENSWNKPYDP